jgi:hypothetical protein
MIYLGFECGGGWIERKFSHKPKFAFFTALASGWLVISVTILMSVSAGLALSVALFSPEAVLGYLALLYWMKEPPIEKRQMVRDPEFKLRNLY